MKKIIKNKKADLNKVSGGSFKSTFKKYGPKAAKAALGVIALVAAKKAADNAIIKAFNNLMPGKKDKNN